MSANDTSMFPDPYLMTIQQKREFFERSSKNEKHQAPLGKSSSMSSLPVSYPSRKRESKPVMVDKSTSSTIQSSTGGKHAAAITTPVPVRRNLDRSGLFDSSPLSNSNSFSVSNIINNFDSGKPSSGGYSKKSLHTKLQTTVMTDPSSTLSMKEFHDVFRDLDMFIGKELNEIECRKRLGVIQKDSILKEIKERDSDYEDKVMGSLKKLKDDINEIKENQKCFEEKMRKHELNQIYMRKKNEIVAKESERLIEQVKKASAGAAVADEPPKKAPILEKPVQRDASVTTVTTPSSKSTPLSSHNTIHNKLEKLSEIKKPSPPSVASSNASAIAESGFSREERIRKLELEIYKEETLMMKINRVLENVKSIDERNLPDIINIERHYLVASARFQAALSELRKLNDLSVPAHLPPYNRKGKLFVRDIMVEVRSSYFQRSVPSSNEFLLAVMKYEDKIYATKPVRITDDVRIVKFSEKFSIPEIYMDFDMRLEIYGTTFWRKNASTRDTLLKKYGFVTFSLADTGNKSKRFTLIETLKSDNVPIRSKVMMKISQKITTDVKYKGPLFVKLRDVWQETTARLNGHLLEFTFAKKNLGTDYVRTQETMLLDLYNAESDAVIPVDSRRVSEKPYTFLIKFNHYVDVTNFYIMAAADSDDHFAEWVSAINKVLALIK